MKKYLIILICLFIIGCGNNSKKNVFDKVNKKSSNLDSYNIKGELSMYNGDTKYTYDVDVKYKKESFYRVSLVNKVNNHEQIILRNNDSVYVLTPSLNKSFKFQSDWPYNNSQVYILERIVNDIKNDEEKKYEHIDDMHMFKTKVVYSTNNDLTYQKVYFDNEYKMKKVEVYNKKDEKAIEFIVNSFEENCDIDNNIFELKNNIDISVSEKNNENKKSNSNVNSNTSNDSNSNINSSSNQNVSKDDNNTADSENTENVSKTVEDVVYPMYLPENTYLTKQDRVSKDDGERVIMTFGGDKSFTLIEETVSASKDLDLDVTYGEPGIIIDTIGSIDDTNINWVSNNIEYSVISNDLDRDELITVAKSISSKSITK